MAKGIGILVRECGTAEKEESTEKTSGKFRVKLYLIYVKKLLI